MKNSQQAATKDEVIAAIAADVSETATLLFSAGSVADTLSQVVNLAVSTIEGCDFAGIFLLSEGTVRTAASTHPLVTEIDQLQQQAGQGPCLDAISTRTSCSADDLNDEARWPLFAAEAAAAGVRSILAHPLAAKDTVGALNLYASFPRAFGVVDRARGEVLAALAALALSTAQGHEQDERHATNLHAALDTREVIGQAQGILMERERITPDQAFDVLRRASQHLNLKLREVAQQLVDTGERPFTGPTTGS